MTQHTKTGQFARLGILATLLASSFVTQAQPADVQTRGQLLYTTHCISCHSTDMHWRNNRQAYDWDSLKFQVRRWQGNTGLQWADADVVEVARYLNDTIYQFPHAADGAGIALSEAAGKDSGMTAVPAK